MTDNQVDEEFYAGLNASPRRIALWSVMFLCGAISGIAGLLKIGYVDVVTSVCSQERTMHVAFSWPGNAATDFSDPYVNVEDCYEP
jgi:hypothetical protein